MRLILRVFVVTSERLQQYKLYTPALGLSSLEKWREGIEAIKKLFPCLHMSTLALKVCGSRCFITQQLCGPTLCLHDVREPTPLLDVIVTVLIAYLLREADSRSDD
jgi:hypothetical protein